MCRHSLWRSEYAEAPAPVRANLSMVPLQNLFAVLSHNKHLAPKIQPSWLMRVTRQFGMSEIFSQARCSRCMLCLAPGRRCFFVRRFGFNHCGWCAFCPLAARCIHRISATMRPARAGRQRDLRTSCITRSGTASCFLAHCSVVERGGNHVERNQGNQPS